MVATPAERLDLAGPSQVLRSGLRCGLGDCPPYGESADGREGPCCQQCPHHGCAHPCKWVQTPDCIWQMEG